MKFSNLTDHAFWHAKYRLGRPRYRTFDPYYGKNGLLARAFAPWLKGVENVFEIGCGSSRYMMFFNLVAGLETYGLDFSAQGLENLERMAEDHNIVHRLCLGDMFEHEMDGRKFDLVFHSGLVEHFTDLGAFFKRCRFFCRDRGLMIFLMPNMQNLAWQWHQRICPNNFAAHIRYEPKKIAQAMSPYFTLTRAQSWGYPQLYAGGPPESIPAFTLKYINLGLMLWISYLVPNYQGTVGKRLASTWFFVCRAK